MKILLRKAIEGHNNLFQWSTNGQTWYPINYKNIIPIYNGNPLTALEPFREAMNQMRTYPGFWISVFDGSYDKKRKVLKVKNHA